MTEKIFLGTLKINTNCMGAGERVYLTKHTFDCGWYWGFGYIGNSRCHTHFDSTFLGEGIIYEASKLFEKPTFTDTEWWIVRDLMIQAYALKEAAAIYQHGGHQTTCDGLTNILKSEDKAKQLNTDLQLVLDTLWLFLTRDRSELEKQLDKAAELRKVIDKQEAILEGVNKKRQELEKELSKIDRGAIEEVRTEAKGLNANNKGFSL